MCSFYELDPQFRINPDIDVKVVPRAAPSLNAIRNQTLSEKFVSMHAVSCRLSMGKIYACNLA